ncbi:MAG: hypothetical protein JNK65_08135 [Deltaproteobacteria bacterium]|nr:hypothetical protein [Deltaproteobacteria bacterium]
MILQLYRHALLVSQHRLAGLEYVFSAPSVDSNWISRIRTVLQTLQIPFLLRINHLRENREEIIEEGLTAFNLSHLDESRVRVIPSIPEWGLKKILGRVAEGIENNQRDLSESMDDSLNPETSLSRYRGIQETFHAARQFIEEQLDQRIHSLDALSDLARDMSSEERLSALEELSVDTPFEFVSSERQAPVSLRQLLYAIERGDLNQTPLSIELRIRRVIELFDAVQSQIDLLDE